LKHYASPQFWASYRTLPESIQSLADKSFAILKENPSHPSLHFKKIGELWSVRIGAQYRALGIDVEKGIH
jgi:hypothetical protein